MPAEEKFHVYITGEAIDGHELSAAQELFAEKFKLTTEKVDRVFDSSMPLRVKRGVDFKIATAYRKAILAMGLDSHIEPVVVLKANPSAPIPQIATESKSHATIVNPKDTSVTATEILYDAPNTVLSQESGGVSMGGWLKCFQVINVLSLVLTTLLFFAGLFLTVMEGLDQEGAEAILVDFVGSLPIVVFCVLILRILSNRSEEVPRRVSRYLNFKFLTTIGVFWLLSVFYYSDIEQPMEVVLGRSIGLLLTMMYCWIWMFYFKRSKRVKEYYSVDGRYHENVAADGASENDVGVYSQPSNELSSTGKEREFKVPIVAFISPVIMVLIYAGYVVASSTGNDGIFDSLKPVSFNVFLFCELALLAIIVYSKKQLDGFLKLYPVINDRESLALLRAVLKNNSFSAVILMFFLGLGALTSIVTIANTTGSEGIIVSGLCLLAMGFMAWYTPSEQKVKQLKCTNESLEEELVVILGKWGNKVIAKR